jgi:hypothetical protein
VSRTEDERPDRVPDPPPDGDGPTPPADDDRDRTTARLVVLHTPEPGGPPRAPAVTTSLVEVRWAGGDRG